MVYQTNDVLKAMEQDTGNKISELAVDGGAVANNFLMQFQSDISNIPILRPANIESTSLGAAYLAGLKAGVWKDADELRSLKGLDKRFEPEMDDSERKRLLDGWEHALRQVVV
jgi:glycerol kinase